MDNKNNMFVELVELEGEKIAIVRAEGLVIKSAADVLDMMADVAFGFDCKRIAISKENVTEEFFDLKTGLAGEILQKYVNYRIKLAIWGDFSTYSSKSLRDFIYESNKGEHVFLCTMMMRQ